MIREIHGIDDARKMAMAGTVDSQEVTVTDGQRLIELSLSTSSYPAGLTSDQARYIAKQLHEAADRLDQKYLFLVAEDEDESS